MELSLFPLPIQLLPGGVTLLRIIEPRYLRMLGLGHQRGMGLCMLGEPRQDGALALLPIGTRIEIIDFEQLEDQTLGLTVQGVERFRLLGADAESDGLLKGEVESLPNWEASELVPAQQVLAARLEQIFAEHPDFAARYPAPQWANACWVAQRWLEVLPLPAEEKLAFMAGDDCSDTLHFLMQVVHEPERLH